MLASYVDRVLGADARALADRHLAECASCRDDLVALSAIVHPRSSRRLLRIATPLAAIAAALLVFALAPWRAPDGPDGGRRERMRETTTVGGVGSTRGVMIVAPTDGSVLPPDSVRFTWRRANGDAGYRLTVTDDSGAARWTIDTPDTTVVLPDSVRIVAGRTYLWYVDALGADGGTRGARLRKFRVSP